MTSPRADDAGPYMDGIGVLNKTDELIDALWDEVMPATLGTSTVLIGPFTAWIFLIADRPNASHEYWVLALGISAECVVLGIRAALPWFRASCALSRHTRRMKLETEKRGRGWAQS